MRKIIALNVIYVCILNRQVENTNPYGTHLLVRISGDLLSAVLI